MSSPKVETTLLPIAMGPTSGVTVLNVTSVSGDSIAGTYNTLSGNQPNTYGNAVLLWQNNNQIPYNQAPLATIQIQGNTQSGSFEFPNLQVQLKSYILGFAVGPNVAQICSTAFIPASGTTFPKFQTSIDVQNISTDSAIVNYNTPIGNLPQTNKNWVALWRGAAASYTVAPTVTAQVTNDYSTGQVVINNFPFQRGTTYTVAYFMGSKQTMMAATYTFTT